MSHNFMQSKLIIKNSVKIVLCICLLLVLVQGVLVFPVMATEVPNYTSPSDPFTMTSYGSISVGAISVSSTPSGASVYLDGSYKGTSEMTIYQVSAGYHTLKLTKSGYYDYSETVTVYNERIATVSARLIAIPVTPWPTPYPTFTRTPTTGSISVSSTPSGASVYLSTSQFSDGSYKGTSPMTISSVSEGRYYVNFKKSGYYDYLKSVYVYSGQTASVSAWLTPTPTPTRTPTPTLTPTPIPTPVASFTATPLYGTAPLTVTFTDTSTNTPTSWNWLFGDDSSSTEKNPTHIYTSAGTFTVRLTATNSAGSSTAPCYITVSSPIPTTSTIGIYRTGNFYLASNNTNGGGSVNAFNFGMTGDVPVTGDWNGDGISTVGIFRYGIFYLATRNTPGGGTVNAYSYGQTGDKPIAGDWNGDGKTEVGFFRNGMFYLMSSTGGTYDSFNYGYGLTDDKPIAGDWNGDGKTEVGVFRNGVFYLRGSTGGTYNHFTYGETNDAPIAGDWNTDGKTEVGVFRNGIFYLINGSGSTYAQFNYGASGDVPVAGKWA